MYCDEVWLAVHFLRACKWNKKDWYDGYFIVLWLYNLNLDSLLSVYQASIMTTITYYKEMLYLTIIMCFI